ncbi:hypothetical protein RESH_03208 [Rhodopirellula europaea SH398]|uniref:Uncharacterized protein n=1 Tax=Rhodopirellula europaea SH398 TaxID=1263868 RepID=M5SEQ8_9BACT|nr:hypothetical protein RESH_03208 [Rhodopirellula europaea SH398]
MNAMSPHCLSPSQHGLIRLREDSPANRNHNKCRIFQILREPGTLSRDRRFDSHSAS